MFPSSWSRGYGSIERAVAAIKAGATDYLAKPVRPAQLEVAVDQALELSRLQRENRSLKEEVTGSSVASAPSSEIAMPSRA
jgi:DNA-binding NtrC family response regulator